MSTSVVHPGASKAPSGKTIGMLVGGLAAAIVLGFVFYLNQSQDVTVSGTEATVGQGVTDSWLTQHEASQKAEAESYAAAEVARFEAMRPASQAAATRPLPEIVFRPAYQAPEIRPLPEVVSRPAYEAPEIRPVHEGSGIVPTPELALAGQSTKNAATTIEEIVAGYLAERTQSQINEQKAADMVEFQFGASSTTDDTSVNPALAHEFGPR